MSKNRIVAAHVEGHIWTEGIIEEDYPIKLLAQIAALSPSVTKIIHHINSRGGDVYAGFAGYHELMKIGKPIKSIIEGRADSMATFLAIAPAAEVEMLKPSTFMIHEPLFPDGVPGKIDDLEKAKVQLEQIRNDMAQAYAKKTGKTVDAMLAMMKKETRMDADLAKREGFVDIVTESEPTRIAALASEFATAFNEQFMKLFGKTIMANGPKSIDLNLKGGGAIHVESENGDLMNKKVTLDGKPADGAYDLEDGRTLVCTGGMVTEVKQAAPPQENTEAKIQQMQAELDKLRAADAARLKAEEEKKAAEAKKAEDEKVEAAKKEQEAKVAALAKEIEDLKKKTVGTTDAPNMSTTHFSAPYMGVKHSSNDMAIRAMRTYMATYKPHMERFYKDGKFADGTRFHDYREGGPSAVSILETNLNYTYDGILDLDIFTKPTLGSPALSDLCIIDTDAKFQKKYHLYQRPSKILKPYNGCGQAVTGTTTNITSKGIQLKRFQMVESFCRDDFDDYLSGSFNVLAEEWFKTGNASYDPAGTPIDRIVMEGLKDGLRIDIFRRATMAAASSSSADWNQIDGMWTNLINDSGASNYCVLRTGSALGTGTLADGTAAAAFKRMWNNAPRILKQEGIDKNRAVIWVTRSMWDNYYDSMLATTNGAATTEASYQLYLEGKATLTYKGIPVRPVTIWDDFLADSANPLFATTRHLALLTIRENHIFGVENMADLEKIESWFEMKDQKRYYRSNATLGFQKIHCDLQVIEY